MQLNPVQEMKKNRYNIIQKYNKVWTNSAMIKHYVAC